MHSAAYTVHYGHLIEHIHNAMTVGQTGGPYFTLGALFLVNQALLLPLKSAQYTQRVLYDCPDWKTDPFCVPFNKASQRFPVKAFRDKPVI